MIPLGSVGGYHIKVTEEASALTTVTFCGGSNGSERREFKRTKTQVAR